MRGANHLPLYSGLRISGRAQGPHPETDSQMGLETEGAIHSPSSSSDHSSGFCGSRGKGINRVSHQCAMDRSPSPVDR